MDVCETTLATAQAGQDGDGEGEACDADVDGDVNSVDNCPGVPNAAQLDSDGDLVGDMCDSDDDGDGDPDANDCAPLDPLVSHGGFERCSGKDENCNGFVDEGSSDSDGDGAANRVDGDDDGDGFDDGEDNCPTTANANHLDTEGDGIGDVCDDDGDEDTIPAPPAADRDGDTLLGSDDGVIRVLDRTGAVKWTYTALTTSIKGTAAIAGGRGYIGDSAGNLYCFGP